MAHRTGGLESETYFEMRIHNSGKQIAPEDLERMFDPFVRTTDYGTGIGLVLAKKIIEDHSGSISVKSNEQVPFLPCGSLSGKHQPDVFFGKSE